MPKTTGLKKKTKKKSGFIFEILDSLTNTKKDLSSRQEFEKEYDPFMVNRWLSMSPQTILEAEYLHRLVSSPKIVHYRALLGLLPKIGKVRFAFKKQTKATAKEAKAVSHYYNISVEKANGIIERLTKEQLKSITDLYKDHKEVLK